MVMAKRSGRYNKQFRKNGKLDAKPQTSPGGGRSGPGEQKLHRHLVEGITEALKTIFTTKRYADKVVELYGKTRRKWGARDRRFFAENVYEVVRWRRRLWYAAGFDDSEFENRRLYTFHNVMKLWAAYRIVNRLSVPDWGDLSELEVEAVTYRWNNPPTRAIRNSIPDWLDHKGEDEFKDRWDSILESLNRPADVFIRVNTLRGDSGIVTDRLSDEGIGVEPVDGQPETLRLIERKNLFITPAFREGLFEVQDSASQLIAPLLKPEPGMRVVDACAGVGGKSLHLAALMQNKGKLIALDTIDKRLKELQKRASRNGVDIIESRTIDSQKVIKRLYDTADRLLLDVPCSGLGVLRRNPDSKWKLAEDEIEGYLSAQREILERYSPITKPGGKMVYATCSILHEENEEQIRGFLEKANRKNECWRLIREVRLNPDEGNHDGFYAALLERIE